MYTEAFYEEMGYYSSQLAIILTIAVEIILWSRRKASKKVGDDERVKKITRYMWIAAPLVLFGTIFVLFCFILLL